jgi:hypothetical protein
MYVGESKKVSLGELGQLIGIDDFDDVRRKMSFWVSKGVIGESSGGNDDSIFYEVIEVQALNAAADLLHENLDDDNDSVSF